MQPETGEVEIVGDGLVDVVGDFAVDADRE